MFVLCVSGYSQLIAVLKSIAVHFVKPYLSTNIVDTRNPASRASKRARLVAMYIAVAIRLSSYVHRVTSEAVSFLPEVIDQI